MLNRFRSFCAAALSVAFVSPALAHVTLEKPESPPKSGYKAIFRVPHGCDGSTTTAVRITIPEGIIAAKPMPKPGWTLNITKGAYAKSYKYYGENLSEGPKEISWVGGSLPDEQYDEFVVNAYVSDAFAPGSTIYFPVVQDCEKGSNKWVGIPKEGQSAHDLGEPAPSLKIVAAAAPADGGKTYSLGDLVVASPWIRATPGGAKVAGGFVKISNNDHHPDRLIAASLEAAGTTQIHEMKMDGDVMKMAELPGGIEIAPHGTLSLEPGKFHLMFLDLKQPLKEGDHVKGSLTFEKAGKLDVEFVVKGIGEGAH